MGRQRQGLVYGVAVYILWGLSPLYWSLLDKAGAVEVLSHRIVWSLVITMLLVVMTSRIHQFRVIFGSWRRAGLLAIGALLLSVNWGLYIWGVNHGRVIEASLGYFITPLVSVLLGVFVLGERMRRWQWAAVAVAALAVVGLAIEYGRAPWIALALAATFGIYGLAKKAADTGAVESLAFETLVVGPLALGYLIWLGPRGHIGDGGMLTVLLLTCGIVTVVPLLLFGAAAIRMPLSTLGLIQYLTPIIQFVLGVAVYHETMSPMRWAGFVLVWIALAVFTTEAIRHRRAQLQLAAEASAL